MNQRTDKQLQTAAGIPIPRHSSHLRLSGLRLHVVDSLRNARHFSQKALSAASRSFSTSSLPPLQHNLQTLGNMAAGLTCQGSTACSTVHRQCAIRNHCLGRLCSTRPPCYAAVITVSCLCT